MTDLFDPAQLRATEDAPGETVDGAAPAPASTRGADKGGAPRRQGIDRMQVALVAALVVALCWGAWMTRAVLDLRSENAPFVKVQLQKIITEYVQGQARSATPPEQIQAETARFMGALDAAMKHAAGEGQVVMVNEAIVAGDVPDVTDAVRAEVYTKVPRPQMASAGTVETRMRDYLIQNGGGNAPVR